MDDSNSPSPPRKRQRMSSPTYDEQVDLSQDDIAAFDRIEERLSQSQSRSQSPLKGQIKGLSAKEKRQRAIEEALRAHHPPVGKENRPRRRASTASPSKEPAFSSKPRVDLDSENPFNVSNTNIDTTRPLPGIYPSFQSASAHIPINGFTAASIQPVDPLSSSQPHSRSPSPEAPPEQDFSAWFAPLPEAALPPTANLFATASALPGASSLFSRASATPVIPSAAHINDAPGPAPKMMGFMTASRKGFLAPSATALEEAKKKFRVWQEGDPEEDPSLPHDPIQPSQESPLRLSFGASDPSFSTRKVPETPTPAGMGFGRALMGGPSTSFPSPSLNKGASRPKPKAFVSPLLKKQSPSVHASGFTSSPLNPRRAQGFGFTPASAATQHAHPLAGTPLNASTTPSHPSTPTNFVSEAGLITPMRPLLGITPRSVVRSTPAKFNTPFKPGMRPGEAGRLALDSASKPATMVKPVSKTSNAVAATSTPRALAKGKGKERWRAFDLSVPSNRKTLATSGLTPQAYDSGELEAMGLNALELSQITPLTAPYYSFHATSTTPLGTSLESQTVTLLDPTAALEQLLAKGCVLATKPWVDNHWAMILWKLAGMVCLDPERESDGREKRWSWGEVMRQLLYRYERELNGGARPPFRNITTQDAPAASPMVLCISNITWSPPSIADDGMPIAPHPELELTDGWYRLRAQVDESLARAVRSGLLKVGKKIAVAGARLSSERKDPMEVLDAYNSTRLVISGNSSHLAPWHAKLGFQRGPCISTLHHLNGDGGPVAVMAIVIIKAYPVAFIEFIEKEDGTKEREGPRNENEEAEVNEKWKARREIEVSKLRAEHDKRINTLEGYADRLERRAGPRFAPREDDYAPDNIDDLYDELEGAAQAANVIAHVTTNEAGWLAKHIREKSMRDREAVGEEIEQELQKTFPPREVRNFRILVVKDAYSSKRPSRRQAQLTVWDALSLSLSEGSRGGSFEAGQRFMVTSLVPTQPNAWMDREEINSEVYLSSRRDSRWTRLK